MKHVFRLNRLVWPLLLLLGLSITTAQAQLQFRLKQSFGGTSLRVTLQVSNVTTQPVTLGDCDFVFNNNTLAVNQAAVATAFTNASFSNNSQYGPLSVQEVTGNIIVGIRLASTATTGAAVAPLATDSICAVTLPILNCALSNNVSWVFNQTNVTDRNYFVVISNPQTDLQVLQPNPLPLAPQLTLPALTATAGNPARPSTPAGTLALCGNETITFTIPAVPRATTYQFFNGNTPLAPASANRTLTLPRAAPTLANGDQILCEVTNPDCKYRSSRIIIQLQDTLAAPQLLNTTVLDTGICGVGLAGQTKTVSVANIPTTSNFSWAISPAGLATITPGPGVASSATITFTGAPGLVTLRVWANNFCGRGDTTIKTFRIYGGIPTLTAQLRRAFKRDSTARDRVYYVNNPNNQYFEFPYRDAGVRNYEWAVYPSSAPGPTYNDLLDNRVLIDGQSQTTTFGPADLPYLLPSRQKDSLRVRISWSRFNTDSVGYVKYRARNACGATPWDSMRVVFKQLVPKPLSVSVVGHRRSAITGDSLCQGTDTTVFQANFAAAFAGTKYADVAKYRYFIVRDDAESQLRLAKRTGKAVNTLPSYLIQPTVNPPLDPTKPAGFRKYLVADSNRAWAVWNRLFYGSVRLVAAAMTDTGARYGGLPTSRLATANVYAPGADTSSMGDTAHVKFFIVPRPLQATKPIVALPSNTYRAVHRGVDTVVTFCLSDTTIPEYSTSGQWLIRPIGSAPGFQTSDVGTFVTSPVAGTNRCIKLRLRPDARPGYYIINMRGINECGAGDTLVQGLKIHITDTAARRPAAIKLLTITSLPGYDFCQGTATTCYSVPLADSSDFTYYRWTLTPANAGTISYTGINTTRTDSGSICITWNPTFRDAITGATLTVTGINGTNRFSANPALHSSTAGIKVYPKPTAYAGMMSLCPLTMPEYSSAWMGGGLPLERRYNAPAGPFPPTISNTFARLPSNIGVTWRVFQAPADSALFMTSLTNNRTINTITGNPSQWNFMNPVFKPTVPGTYKFSLIVTDSSGCKSDSSVAEFNVLENINISVRGLLAGALVRPASSGLNPLMKVGYFTSPSAAFPRPGGWLSRYERNVGQCGTDFMNPGYPIKRIPLAPDSAGPIDVVTVGVVVPDVCDPVTNQPQFNTFCEGKAWLYPDGSVRDFETGLSPFVRATGGERANYPTGGVIYLKHPNHLTLYLLQSSPLKPGLVDGDGPGSPIDLRLQTNAIRQATYVSGIGSENVVTYPPATPTNNRRVAAIAGKVSERDPAQVNSYDLEKLIKYLNDPTTQRTDVYQGLDINLDSKVDALDLAIMLDNVKQAKHGLLNK